VGERRLEVYLEGEEVKHKTGEIEVTVHRYPGNTAKAKVKTILSHNGLLAVYKELNYVRWIIVHVRTGLSIQSVTARYRTRREAVLVMDRIEGLGWDWDTWTDELLSKLKNRVKQELKV